MGNANASLPKEDGAGHPEPYLRGVTAAKEGRFTLSEVYFVQAMKMHPGCPFWETLLGAVLADPKEHTCAPESPVDPDEPASPLPAFCESPTTADSSSNQDSAALDEAGQMQKGLQSAPSSFETAQKSGSRAKVLLLSKKTLEHVIAAPALKIVEVILPLDDDLKDVLDFARLLADIALTYLDLLATTPHPEKVLALAARYSIAIVTHSQALLHCLTLWKDENLCDGLGFVDYAGRRSHASQAALREAEVLTVGEQVQGAKTGDGEGVVGGRGYSVGHRKASPAAWRCFTLASVEATCRYYFLSFTVNYAVLLMKSMGTMPDEKRRVQVFTNTVSHLDAVFELMHDVANENPGEYLSKVILELFPAPSAASSRNPAGSGAISLGPIGSHLLLVDNGQHRHLYSCASPWTPFQSGMVPLALARRARLVLLENTDLRKPTRLTSPGQRMSYHYQSWLTKATFFAVPGCSPYLLTRALPGFVPGRGTVAHEAEAVRRSMAVTAPPGRTPDGAMTDKHGVKLAKKLKSTVGRNGRFANSDLNFADERTFVMLCQNEACLVGGSALVNSAQLYKALEQEDAAVTYAASAVALAAALNGPESVEVMVLQYVLNGGLRDSGS